jgi:uncharacterized repeat protein (TIGR01451 family)
MNQRFSTFSVCALSTAWLPLFMILSVSHPVQAQSNSLPPPQKAFSPTSQQGQQPSAEAMHMAPHHPHGSAPLFYVRITGPSGLHATFYQGSPQGHEYAAPVTVGLRPGYIYRIKLTGLPGHPTEALYPSLEVRGSLVMPPDLRAADFPATIVFSKEDIDKVLQSGYLTKVLVLEHPDQAMPDASQKDHPLEIETASPHEAMTEARVRGRLMLILRWGERTLTADELAQQSIPGTILLPDQQTLPPAAVNPMVPWACMPIYDPILGPKLPEEECLHDGGDIGPRAGINALGQLGGLNPTDTVAVYADSRGKKHIAVSNRVCICVPRFVVLRTINFPGGLGATVAVQHSDITVAQMEVRSRERADVALQNEQLRSMASRKRPSGSELFIGPRDLDQYKGGAVVFGFIEGHAVIGAVVKPPEERPDMPLLLCKSADRKSAEVGDVITFTLKYSNVGGKPITGVVVSDSLTGRLEYVLGSAKSDRHTTFTTEPNEAGSAILRWAVTGALPPGQSGTVTFQARIR